MIVYIDSLFLTNLFMDSVLMLVTALFLKKSNNFRILLGALFLSLWGTIIFFIEISRLLSSVLNISSVVIGIQISFGNNNLVKNSLVFLITSFMCGGIIFALTNFSSFGVVTNAVISNGTLYMNLNPVLLVIGCIILYASAEIFKRINIKNFSRDRLIIDVCFTYMDKIYKVKSLIDTGCSLTEPLSGEPMLIVDKDTVSVYDDLEIWVNTANGRSKMKLIFPDKIWSENTEMNISPNTPVAVSGYKINTDGIYNGILNPDAIINNRKEREICQDLVV